MLKKSCRYGIELIDNDSIYWQALKLNAYCIWSIVPYTIHQDSGDFTQRVHKVSFPWAGYRNKTQFNGNFYWNRYSKSWTIFQHIHPRNWDICHTVGPTFVSLCRRSLPPGIGTSLSQNTVRITFHANMVYWYFVMQGDSLWCQCIDCFLVSGVIAGEMSMLTPCA